MAAAAVNLLVLGLSGVGFVSVVKSFIADAKPPQYTVTVGIGDGTTSDAQLDGDTPGVSLWTASGEAIGGMFGSSKTLAKNTPYKASFAGNSSLGEGQAPAEYVSVTNGGDDGICVAYIAVSEPTGAKRLFFGDIAANCGAGWYPSTLLVQDFRPKCFWLDRDNSNGNSFQGVGIHMPSFSNEDEGAAKGLGTEYLNNTAAMCKSGPRFKLYDRLQTEDPILFFSPPFTQDDFNANGSDKDISKLLDSNRGKMTQINMVLANKACASQKGCPNIHDQIAPKATPQRRSTFDDQVAERSSKKRRSTFSEQLVISHFQQHSAVEVCESENSRGPDFVSVKESKFCDMDTKILWDVCSESIDNCCFDINAQQMRACGARGTISARKLTSKVYSEVRHWGLD